MCGRYRLLNRARATSDVVKACRYCCRGAIIAGDESAVVRSPAVANFGLNGAGKSTLINKEVRASNLRVWGRDADLNHGDYRHKDDEVLEIDTVVDRYDARCSSDEGCSDWHMDRCLKNVTWSDATEVEVHPMLAQLDLSDFRYDYIVATGDEGHTTVSTTAIGPGTDMEVVIVGLSPDAVLFLFQALSAAVEDAAGSPRIADSDSSSPGSDNDDISPSIPALLTQLVRDALRLMGYIQPAEQIAAFMDMVQGQRPVAFPSAIRQFIGLDIIFRPKQPGTMHAQQWIGIAKRILLGYTQPCYNRYCAVLLGCVVCLGPSEACGLDAWLLDTKGTSGDPGVQLQLLSGQGLMPIHAVRFVLGSTPEGEAAARDMRQLASSGVFASALRSLECRRAVHAATNRGIGEATRGAAHAAHAMPLQPASAHSEAVTGPSQNLERCNAIPVVHTAGAGPSCNHGPSAAAAPTARHTAQCTAHDDHHYAVNHTQAHHKKVPVLLVILGDRVFDSRLRDIGKEYRLAQQAGQAAVARGLLELPAMQRLLQDAAQYCNNSITSQASALLQPATDAPALHNFYNKCEDLRSLQQDLADRQHRAKQGLLEQLVSAVRSQALYVHASSEDVQAALQGVVEVITLYPRLMWDDAESQIGYLPMTEEQGGAKKLEEFTSLLANAVHQQEAAVQEKAELQQLVTAVVAMVQGAKELVNMAWSDGGLAEQLVELLKAHTSRWNNHLHQLQQWPWGKEHSAWRQLLCDRLAGLLHDCTPEHAAAAVVLGLDPSLAEHETVKLKLHSTRLDGLLKQPKVQSSLKKPKGGYKPELRHLLMYGTCRVDRQAYSWDVNLPQCIYGNLYSTDTRGTMPDASEFDVYVALAQVQAAMHLCGPGKTCRAAVEKLYGSSSLPLYAELAVQVVDSVTVDSMIVAASGMAKADADALALYLHNLAGTLQQSMLHLLHIQLRPIASLSQLWASIQPAMDSRLSQFVKQEVCSKLRSGRGLRMAVQFDDIVRQLLTSDTANVINQCIDLVQQQILRCLNVPQLLETVDLWQQGSAASTTTLLERVHSPYLLPELQQHVLHATAVAGALLPAVSSCTECGDVMATAAPEALEVQRMLLVQKWAEVFKHAAQAIIGSNRLKPPVAIGIGKGTTTESMEKSNAASGAQAASSSNSRPSQQRVSFDISQIPKHISKFIVKPDIVAAFLEYHQRSFAGTVAAHSAILHNISQEVWDAWEGRLDVQDITLPRILYLGNLQPDLAGCQERMELFTTSGRDKLAINVLLYEMLLLPLSDTAACFDYRVRNNRTAMLQEKLAAAARWQQQEPATTSKPATSFLWEPSELELDLLITFAAGCPYRAIDSFGITAFDDHLRYLRHVAHRAYNQAGCKGMAKPAKAGDWLVLLGKDAETVQLILSASTSQSSSQNGSSHAAQVVNIPSRLYGQLQTPVHANDPLSPWLVQLFKPKDNSIEEYGTAKLQRDRVLLLHAGVHSKPGNHQWHRSNGSGLCSQVKRGLLSTRPLSHIEAALLSISSELRRLRCPVTDPAPLLEKVYDGIVGENWEAHAVPFERGSNRGTTEKIFIYKPPNLYPAERRAFDESGFLAYVKKVKLALNDGLTPPEPISHLTLYQQRIRLNKVDKHVTKHVGSADVLGNRHQPASAADSDESDGCIPSERPAKRRRLARLTADTPNAMGGSSHAAAAAAQQQQSQHKGQVQTTAAPATRARTRALGSGAARSTAAALSAGNQQAADSTVPDCLTSSPSQRKQGLHLYKHYISNGKLQPGRQIWRFGAQNKPGTEVEVVFHQHTGSSLAWITFDDKPDTIYTALTPLGRDVWNKQVAAAKSAVQSKTIASPATSTWAGRNVRQSFEPGRELRMQRDGSWVLLKDL